jgi:hypothetical protein
MMRLAVFTVIGWALSVTGEGGTQPSPTNADSQAAAASSTVIEVAQLDPSPQAGDEATGDPAATSADENAAPADENGAAPERKKPLPKRSPKPGWLDDIPDRKPQTSIIKRLIELVDSAEKIDPEGKMHKKITDDQKETVRKTLLEIDFDMQRLLKGDPSIAERDPNKKEYFSEEEARDAMRDRTMARPKPKPPFAKTPGVVKKDKDERVYEERGGEVFDGGGGVNTGTQNRHGTVIHRGKFTRGGGGGPRTPPPPKVINIPPSKRPAPPAAEPETAAEPEPAGREN